jgi:preprotein translocase subunit SecA
MLSKLINKILGDSNAKEIKRLEVIVARINEFGAGLSQLSDEELKNKTDEFRERIKSGATVDELLPEAFAVVKDACRRLVGTSWDIRGNSTKWDMIPYDVQLLGGIAIHEGKIAEMKTGEGKTLVCTLPLYLNALAEKGCHLVTVNNYLARRDAEWMGGLFRFLGMTVGVLDHGIPTDERKAAYNCDITYGTNTEFGFDYLRDNMARSKEELMQRKNRLASIRNTPSSSVTWKKARTTS